MSWRSASSGKPWFRAASWSSSSVISGPAAVFMRLFEAVDEEHGVGLDVVDLDACRLGHLFSYLFPAVLAAFKGVLVFPEGHEPGPAVPAVAEHDHSPIAVELAHPRQEGVCGHLRALVEVRAVRLHRSHVREHGELCGPCAGGRDLDAP